MAPIPADNCPSSPSARRAVFAIEDWPCRAKRREARRLVGLGRFELPTSRLSSARSNQLSYKPEKGPDDRPRPLATDFAIVRQGSSMKKEKRRRRCPANGRHRFEADGLFNNASCDSKRSERERVRRL